MTPDIHCSNCHAPLLEAVSPCPHCGGVVAMVLRPEGVEVKAEVTPPALQMEGATADGGTIVGYRSSGGAQSQSRETGGKLQFAVAGPVETGTRGEGEVARILAGALRAQGREAVPGQKAKNQEDDVFIVIDNHQVPVQIVSTPGVPDFWREVAQGSASTTVSPIVAADWVHATLEAKAGAYPAVLRSPLLLAIDCRHMALVASPSVVQSYLSRFGDPAQAFGFGGVWLVGPRESRCTQLGNGKW